jgi:hypothetical protein
VPLVTCEDRALIVWAFLYLQLQARLAESGAS